MGQKRCLRIAILIVISILLTCLGIGTLNKTNTKLPKVKNGRLNLLDWDQTKAFALTGEWEFYWDQLLSSKELEQGGFTPLYMQAPAKWNYYKIDGNPLPAKGKATYRIQVEGAKVDKSYGIRLQTMYLNYELYVDDILIAQNGRNGSQKDTKATFYEPQIATFTPKSESFEVVLQMKNDMLGVGGMWQPIIFGTSQQILTFDRQLSSLVTATTSGLIFSSIIFLMFFFVQKREKNTVILSCLTLVIVLRLTLIGDVAFTKFFPDVSIGVLYRIDFLTMPWAAFLLLFFIDTTYRHLIPRWQLLSVFGYTTLVSFFILVVPMDASTSAYLGMNYILLVVMLLVTIQLIRSVLYKYEGALFLLLATILLLVMIGYEMFTFNYSLEYLLLKSSGFQYLIFIFAQFVVVALRYKKAKRLELAHLKGQIRPHFIHNALTSIISISRKEPDRARELLVDFSSYLRGFYDYDCKELVPMEQEIELVRAYATLEQARFGEQIHLEFQLEVQNFLLPALSLQPLVENSIVHGLREKENGGTVTVYTSLLPNHKVRIGVRDDGIGMIPFKQSPRQGIGIENINHRLSYLYKTSLTFLTKKESGCEVYFEIPYQEVCNDESMAD